MIPAPDSGDDDLMRRLRAGDEDAFTVVFRRWQGPLFRFALHMSGSRTVAEDATQEVFMTLIRQTAQFDSARGTVGAFLFGIARNQVLKRLERERPYISLSPDWDTAQEAHADFRSISDGSVQSESAERAESIELVRQAILTLPPDYREVVALCDLEEMSYDDAAANLGCSVGTVASRLHRGRALLAAKLRGSREPGSKKTSPAVSRVVSSARIVETNFVSPQPIFRQAQKAPK
jgi:RNA polymerase sigma-70 factor (ECF subfamily)